MFCTERSMYQYTLMENKSKINSLLLNFVLDMVHSIFRKGSILLTFMTFSPTCPFVTRYYTVWYYLTEA